MSNILFIGIFFPILILRNICSYLCLDKLEFSFDNFECKIKTLAGEESQGFIKASIVKHETFVESNNLKYSYYSKRYKIDKSCQSMD